MRVTIPQFQTKQELFTYLKDNKADLISKKCSLPIKSDDFGYNTEVKHTVKSLSVNKAETIQVELPQGEINVTVIGNTAFWCDSQKDVLLPDCWKKTIKERGPKGRDLIYHLKDHAKSSDGVVGYPTDLYSMDIAISTLGINILGTTQSLAMDSIVKRELDRKTYQRYLDKQVKQHSVGMQYIKLDLAINDHNMPSEFAIWNKFYSMVINKDALNDGYFWVVYEIKLFEISSVLFGSNELTPTLEPEVKSTPDAEPVTDHSIKFNVMEAINKTKFLTVN